MPSPQSSLDRLKVWSLEFPISDITMYGADWCGDCRRAKSYLEDAGVAYDYVDLVDNPEQMDEVLQRTGGRQLIPVVVFPDGSHLIEPSTAELAAKVSG